MMHDPSHPGEVIKHDWVEASKLVFEERYWHGKNWSRPFLMVEEEMGAEEEIMQSVDVRV